MLRTHYETLLTLKDPGGGAIVNKGNFLHGFRVKTSFLLDCLMVLGWTKKTDLKFVREKKFIC